MFVGFHFRSYILGVVEGGLRAEIQAANILGQGVGSTGVEIQGAKQVPRISAIGEFLLERLRRGG
jgi:hypothetical protein